MASAPPALAHTVPDPAQPDRPSSLRTLARLLGYLRPYRTLLGISLALAIASQVAALAVPALTGKLVDDALPQRDRDLLWTIVVLIALAGVAKAALMVGRRLLAGRLSLDVERDLRLETYAHMQRLDHAYYDTHQTGQLLSRANADVQVVRMFLGYGLIFMAQHVLTIVAVTALLVWTSPILSLASLVILPPIVWIAMQYSRRSHPVLRDVQQRIADVTTQAEENVVGVRVVKAFAQEDGETRRFAARAEAVFERQVDVARLRALYQPLLSFLPQLGMALILLAGGLLVIRGDLSRGGFFQFNLYLAMLIWPLRMIGMWIGMIQRAIASGERVFEVLDVRAAIADPARPVALPADGGGHVRMRGVSFGYDPDRPVLCDLDLEIAAGATVALVGRTGSGKSTLAALLPRFYDPQAGTIEIDGVDVRDLRLRTLRGAIGLVGEDAFLFSASVRDNIAFGRPDATDAEVIEASRLAQAHEFIDALPDGYETRVGERGLTLSGGQRQRISIARAILLDPRVLVLDDATASVDASTEARIKQGLQTLMEGRTTIVIAHRLSTVSLADEVVVLENGRVAARGTADELSESSGVFHEIWRHGRVEVPEPAAALAPEKTR